MTNTSSTHLPAPRSGAPVQPLAWTTYLTALPSLLMGCYLVGALIISSMRGDEDEWGIGPFVLAVGLALIVIAGLGVEMAQRGQIAERRTARRSAWSVLGLGLAILSTVPAALIYLLIRQ